MGCDIHSYAERRNTFGVYEHIEGIEPFGDRNYGMFSFLAGVRNYSGITPIAIPRGLPNNASLKAKKEYEMWEGDAHSASWLSIEELLNFNYDQECEDRRVTRQIAPNTWYGGCTCDAGEGKKTTYREFLGDYFFSDLRQLTEVGADRVVFWFDN